MRDRKIPVIIQSVILALLCSAMFPPSAFAKSPKEDLIGYWKFKRGINGPCAAQIIDLEYTFESNGKYHGKAKMSTGAALEYHGTFTATDTECTTFVDGVTVGPYPYQISGDILTVSQPEFHCKVQLEREDY